MRKELTEAIQKLEVISIKNACEAIRLNRRRYYRWLHIKPKVTRLSWNRITPQEEAAIVKAGRDELLCDLRTAGLMVYGHDTGKFHCSVSTVYRVKTENRTRVEIGPLETLQGEDLDKIPQVFCVKIAD